MDEKKLIEIVQVLRSDFPCGCRMLREMGCRVILERADACVVISPNSAMVCLKKQYLPTVLGAQLAFLFAGGYWPEIFPGLIDRTYAVQNRALEPNE